MANKVRGKWKETCLRGDVAALVFAIAKYPEHINCTLDEERNTPLSLCITANHPTAVFKLLEGKADPNVCLKDGDTPLHLAARANSEQMVGELFRCRANPAASNHSMELPLHTACKNNNMAIVKKLVASNTETVNFHNRFGQTPLSIACEVSSLDMVNFLIDNGSHVDGCNSQRSDLWNWCNFPVLIAARAGDCELLELLIHKEASLTIKDNHGYTALHHSAEQGNFEVLSLLLRTSSLGIDSITIENHTVLYLSCKSRKYTVTHAVLTKMHESLPANTFSRLLDHAASDGGSCLLLSTENGDKDIIKDLLIFGATISSSRSDGNSPLHVACMNGYHHVAKSFLLAMEEPERTELLNAPNAIGSTSLILAAEEAHIDVVRLLIDLKCNIDHQRLLDGATALFMACLEGHIEVVQLLISFGASYSLGSPQTGAFPLFIACQQGFEEILKVLYSTMNREQRYKETNRLCLDCTSPLYIAAESGYSNIVQTLLTNNANPNHQVDTGSTAIFAASQNGKIEVVRLLLEHKADPCITRKDGISPLFAACTTNQVSGS